MGMFDEVGISCPHCNEVVALQSKAGDCYLSNYSSASVPLVIALDLEGVHYCDSCSQPFTVFSHVPKRATLIAVKGDLE